MYIITPRLQRRRLRKHALLRNYLETTTHLSRKHAIPQCKQAQLSPSRLWCKNKIKVCGSV